MGRRPVRGNAPAKSITPGNTCSPRRRSTSPAEARGQTADGGDFAAGNADIALALAVVIDHGRAAQQEIECLSHSRIAGLVSTGIAPYVS